MAACLSMLNELIQLLTTEKWVDTLRRNDETAIHATLHEIKQSSVNNNKISLFNQLSESGILTWMMNYLSTSHHSEISFEIITVITSIIKTIFESRSDKNETNTTMIFQKIAYAVDKCAPTFGIIKVLYALSRISSASSFFNPPVLNYLLSDETFKPNSICNYNNDDIFLRKLRVKCNLLCNMLYFQKKVSSEKPKIIKENWMQQKGKEIGEIMDSLVLLADKKMWSILLFGFLRLKPQFISNKSFSMIVSQLDSTDISHASRACSVLYRILGTHVTGVHRVHLENFMKYNVLKKISNTSLLIYQKDTKNTIVFNAYEVSCFIGHLIKYTKSEYTVHRIIQYNMMQQFINLLHSESGGTDVMTFCLLPMLKYGNEQHIQFMIHQNIVKYLCDLQWSDVIRHEKWYKNSEIGKDILNSFLRILKCGENNKQLNGGKNIIALLIRKCKKFPFLEKLLAHVKSKQTLFSAWGNSSLISKYAQTSSKDKDIDFINLTAFQLIVSYFIRKWSDNSKVFPQVIETIITTFGFAEYEFSVGYIQIQMSINGMVLMNITKQCAVCKRIDVNIKRCSRCKYVFYCKSECQKADWSSHKSICRKIAKYYQ